MKRSLLGLLVLLGAANGAQAAVIFDFEAEAIGNKGSSYVLNSSGVTLTITRSAGDIEVAFRSTYPASWGNNALSPFLNMSGSGFLLSFSAPFSSISVDVGDFAPSDADTFSLAVGADVASGSQDGTTGFPAFTTLSLTGLNATQAFLSGGSTQFPQSVFWDNITIDVDGTVPEPGTLALLGFGLAGLAASRRRKQ